MSLSAEAQGGGPYVFDASSLINLERKDKELSFLSGLGGRVFISQKVAEEVDEPRSGLSRWISRNGGCIKSLLPEEDRLYRRFITQADLRIHDGEATALAIAFNRDGTLVIDDKVARRKAESHGIPCVSLEGLLNQALIM